MKLETKRLVVRPLSYEQLLKYVRNDHSLEAELNLESTSRTISDELKEALEQTILPNVGDPNKNYLFSTLWTVILKSENRMVGDLCFIGEPTPEGEVEIGYGTYDEFRKKGIMTEAVGSLIAWAKSQPEIKSVSASTESDNIPSYTVLERNGFIKTGEKGTLLNWQLLFR